MEFITLLESSPLTPVFVFLFGTLWGSFYNVVILRLPEHRDLIFARSACPKCQTQLKWFHNIPMVSFIVLGGRCGFCKAPISVQYPLVELATGLLFLVSFLQFGIGLNFLGYTLFLSAMLVLSVIDLRLRIIPDEISLGGIPCGLAFNYFSGNVGMIECLLGIGLGGGSFLLVAYLYQLFTKREGLGGGDIKLMGTIGAWLGMSSILPIIILSSGVGSIVGIVLMVVSKGDMKTAIPFGPFIAAAATLFLFYGTTLVELFFPYPG